MHGRMGQQIWYELVLVVSHRDLLSNSYSYASDGQRLQGLLKGHGV